MIFSFEFLKSLKGVRLHLSEMQLKVRWHTSFMSLLYYATVVNGFLVSLETHKLCKLHFDFQNISTIEWNVYLIESDILNTAKILKYYHKRVTTFVTVIQRRTQWMFNHPFYGGLFKWWFTDEFFIVLHIFCGLNAQESFCSVCIKIPLFVL